MILMPNWQILSIHVRVGKKGSLGPWSRVIVYCSKLSFCQNDSPIGVTVILVFGSQRCCRYSVWRWQNLERNFDISPIFTYERNLCVNFFDYIIKVCEQYFDSFVKTEKKLKFTYRSCHFNDISTDFKWIEILCFCKVVIL